VFGFDLSTRPGRETKSPKSNDGVTRMVVGQRKGTDRWGGCGGGTRAEEGGRAWLRSPHSARKVRTKASAKMGLNSLRRRDRALDRSTGPSAAAARRVCDGDFWGCFSASSFSTSSSSSEGPCSPRFYRWSTLTIAGILQIAGKFCDRWSTFMAVMDVQDDCIAISPQRLSTNRRNLMD
jgi:hypothetical protein